MFNGENCMVLRIKKKLNSFEIVDINVFIEKMDLVGKSKENIV